MSNDALPCIVCERRLDNVFIDADNQPEDGVAFNSPGHYGSRVFDPDDGTSLEINVCDDCLTAAGEKEQVYIQRQRVQVRFEGALVGWTQGNDPPVYWRKGLPEYHPDDAVYLAVEELTDKYWRDKVNWTIPPDILLQQYNEEFGDNDE